MEMARSSLMRKPKIRKHEDSWIAEYTKANGERDVAICNSMESACSFISYQDLWTFVRLSGFPVRGPR